MKRRYVTRSQVKIWILFGCLALSTLFYSGCRPNKMERYLQAAQDVWGFQGSALVAYDGRVILSRGYGKANYAFEEPNTPETKFFIGSITKQFTATAIMLLEERGRLDVDDPISKYLPDYPEPAADKITIRHLLTHTSGVPNYTEVPEVLLRRTSRIAPSELLSLFENEPLEFEPGTDFHYSNSGYIILGAIIEKVSGQSYEAFLHHELLKPVGMLNTGYARREAGVPDRADGYTLDDRRAPIDALPIDFSILHTAGALYSTVADMLKWDIALRNQQIITRETFERMITPYWNNYGFGWVIDTLYGRLHTYHGGFLDGFNCTFERWVNDKLCVIVFSNEDAAPVKKMARALAAIAFNRPYMFPVRKTAIEVDPKALAEFEGVYSAGPRSYRYVTVSGDTLTSQMTGERPERLLPEARDMFFYESDNTVTMRFVRDTAGSVIGYVVNDGDVTEPGFRLVGEQANLELDAHRGIDLPIDILNRYVGSYELETRLGETPSDLTLTVIRQGTTLLAAITGTGDMVLVPVSESDFFHRESDLRVSFETNDSGRVVGCVLKMGGQEIRGRKTR